MWGSGEQLWNYSWRKDGEKDFSDLGGEVLEYAQRNHN